ncbi:hypothetical protein FNH08_39450, partial [Streptomyces spongiae]|nr:hypothetical protein [Streptomyces spongiae]
MNEGKPTKAKWWSRPRAQGTGAGLTPDHMATERASSGPEGGPGVAPGLAGAQGPTGGSSADRGEAPVRSAVVRDDVAGSAGASAAVTARAGATDVGGRDSGGDFELRRPDEVAPDGGAATDGDFELARPAGTAPPRAESRAAVWEAPGGEGDFELERPAAVVTPAPAAAAVPVPAPAPESGSVSVSESAYGAVTGASSVAEIPEPLGPTNAVPASAATADDASSRSIAEAGMPQDSHVGASGGASANSASGPGQAIAHSEAGARADGRAGVSAERPRTLHAPDPYST